MASGWIKLHRKVRENPIFRDSAKLHFWIYCLTEAAYAPHETVVGGKKIGLQPGQFVTGRRRAAEATGLSEKQVRSAMGQLMGQQMVKVSARKGQAGTIVTILNWDSYQGSSQDEGKERAKVGAKDRAKEWATTKETKKQEEVCLSRARASEAEPEPVSVPADLQQLAMQIYGTAPAMQMTEWVRHYGEDWTRRAMAATEGAGRAKCKPAYTQAILARWAKDGGPEDGGTEQGDCAGRRGGASGGVRPNAGAGSNDGSLLDASDFAGM